MGQVVNLKTLKQPQPVTVVTETTYKRFTAKIEKQKAEIKALKARNKLLVQLLRDPFNDYVRQLTTRMRIETEFRRRLGDTCTCIPDRASALR